MLLRRRERRRQRRTGTTGIAARQPDSITGEAGHWLSASESRIVSRYRNCERQGKRERGREVSLAFRDTLLPKTVSIAGSHLADTICLDGGPIVPAALAGFLNREASISRMLVVRMSPTFDAPSNCSCLRFNLAAATDNDKDRPRDATDD